MDHLTKAEQDKYEEIWTNNDYRKESPGNYCFLKYLELIKDKKKDKDTIIDFGCGSGKVAIDFLTHNFKITLIDLASNCLDDSIANLTHLSSDITFIQASLWDLPKNLKPSIWGYCCDVLEHLPTDKIDLALNQISEKNSKGIFFSIHLIEDQFGKTINKKLHLTIKPSSWWLEKIETHWKIKYKKSLDDEMLILYAEK